MWKIFHSVLYPFGLFQNCRHLSENTNICICTTHDNAKHSIRLFSVWHSKNAHFFNVLLWSFSVCFFFSIFCTVSAILHTVRYPWPNDTHFLSNNAFCSTVSGQYQKCEESLSVQLSQLGYRNGLIHSYDRPLRCSPLLIVTFIRIRSTRFYLL